MSGPSIGEVRPSQLITTFGPGAIVDLETLSIIVASIDAWNEADAEVIREHRLERALGIEKLLGAAPAEGSAFTSYGTVPAFIFPRFHHCPVCKTITEVEVGDPPDAFYDEKEQSVVCRTPNCNGTPGARGTRRPAQMVPAPFIVACTSGHLDEFPWRTYAHRGRDGCNQRLRLFSRGETGTVADLWIVCDCTNGSRSMSDAFGDNAIVHIGQCRRGTPWTNPGRYDPECTTPLTARTMQRGATNAWFPIVKSALKIGQSVDTTVSAIQLCDQKQISKINSYEKLKVYLEDGLFEPLEGIEPERIWRKLQELRGEVVPDEEDLRWPEWTAFKDFARYSDPKQELYLQRGSVPNFVSHKIARITLVRKLSEVRALLGFTRVDHLGGLQDDEETARLIMPVYQRDRRPVWLPATEVRGEGLLIELNEAALQDWEDRVSERAAAMAAKHREWEGARNRTPRPFPGARFVLLHTLAHALIRQISIDCGYPASSIRERIYSSSDPSRLMFGVLIYTASPDSEGSLGGLVELGAEDRFPDLLRGALRQMTRCSSDPLCADHEPDAHASINGAACHACQLVAETSCENFNLFLDRSFLVPTLAHSSLAYFDDPGLP
ncbi:DUF1998 domain-containing protein [Bradyrhizobium yuanmingense]|uniref:DUF1998 domain-containing protein n=1 Tax=Bradyrhizobium yuanmingense TaxID=108015 RepID=UPI000FE34CEE|nr:DUF1998 domain-containing protein [Bradyrhizobium yuanmingense]TGN73464.1 DUF1998 domain-containing protein [Bradyrhizobium yuanmingense]